MRWAAALLLGISERAFDEILNQIEDKTKGQTASTQGSQPPALNIITPAGLPDGKVNQQYDQSLVASGGKAPYKWTFTTGALPQGMSLDATGHLTGAPLNCWTIEVHVASNGCLLKHQVTGIQPCNCVMRWTDAVLFKHNFRGDGSAANGYLKFAT